MIIDDSTKSIMSDLENGTAFDTSILEGMGSMNDMWNDLDARQDDLFGSFSPIRGCFEGMLDDSPMTLEDAQNIPGLNTEQQSALVGKAKGVMSNLQSHVEGQFKNITDNLTLYTTHQSVQNAMGSSEKCGGLTEHFGTLMSVGQGISGAIKSAKSTIGEFTAMKQQIQNEISNFDENAIGILTGKVNNTVLARVVKGTGIHDQIDDILTQSGIAKTSTQAAAIRAEIGQHLTPTLNGFFNKKTKLNEEVKAINDQRNGIMGQIGKELAVLDKATTTLRRLGAANSLKSLFKVNECAQTLMGFVGSSGFLGKLGI